MDLPDLLPADKIRILDQSFETKDKFLEFLVDEACAAFDLVEVKSEVLGALMERENSMSTGIGLGIAIPHCSTPHVSDCNAFLAIVKKGVEFQSVDNEPVRIAVLLLLPRDKFERHIKTLASIARLFNDVDFRKHVLTADTPEAIHDLIKSESAAKTK